jgi:hypothetical protein
MVEQASMNTKQIGERSEGVILGALLKIGKTVLMPFGDNQRYDLVVDTDGVFTRIQCKTAAYIRGAVRFKTCSSTAHRKNGGTKDYIGSADMFAVYCPALDKVYLVPVRDCGRSVKVLRVEPAKNGNKKLISEAISYEITNSEVAKW